MGIINPSVHLQWVKVTEGMWFVPAPNRARFPYCNCLYIDDEVRGLIDTSCGAENIKQLTVFGVDTVINSHFHEDHILNNTCFATAQVLAHPLDAPAIQSTDVFLEYYGFPEYGAADLGADFVASIDLKASPVHREYSDGEMLDFGKTKFRVIHCPGHTPGHCVFWDEQNGILFSSDIDLSGFGPWYGHACSNIGDFIASIQKCMALQPRLVISSHKGILTDNLANRFQAYLDKIYQKEEAVLASLARPFTLDELAGLLIFYGPQTSPDPAAYLWEKMAIQQLLNHLMDQGRVKYHEGAFYR